MKRPIAIITLAILLTACAPTPQAIQTAIAQTQAALIIAPSIISTNSFTSVPSMTPTLTLIPMLTPLTVRDDNNVYTISIVNTQRCSPNNSFIVPPTGMSWLCIKIKVTLISGKATVDYYGFKSQSNGQQFDSVYVGMDLEQTHPMLDTTIVVSGISAEGWVMIPIFQNDSNAMLVFTPNIFSNSTYLFPLH